MAMSTCRECQQPVSTDAKACPACGAAQPTVESGFRRANRLWTALTVIFLVAVAGLAFYFYDQSKNEEDEFQDQLDCVVALRDDC